MPVLPAAAVRAVRDAAAVPLTVASPTSATAAAAADPVVPAATAASAGSLIGTAAGLLGLVTGGGGSPAAAPLAWAALAVSRRETSGPSRGAAPAETVSTGEAFRTASAVAEDRPFVQSISLPRAGTYGTGTTMTFTLNFSEPVQVLDPNVFVPVQIGFAMRNAAYVGGSGTNRLTFQLPTTANDYGDISIGRVSNQLLPGATAPVRIFDFQGVGHEQALGEVIAPKIIDAQGNAASESIPTVNTSAITVNARGPRVVSYGDNGAITTVNGPLGLLHWTVLTVNFDEPVFVKGAPTVPVTIGGTPTALTYATGSGTATLTFAQLSIGTAPGPAGFPDEGQIIDLPPGANITDRLGNSIGVALGDFGAEPGTLGLPVVENGNRLVVLGAHYQDLGTVTADQLNTVLGAEATHFYNASTIDPYTGANPASYWADYEAPEFVDANNGVHLYRVAYNSTIPEQNNRPTLAYGLVAIPTDAAGPLSVVSYQHGTLVGKGEVPSQSFDGIGSVPGADPLYDATYETRLNVAQFGGQGYAVIAADYFGVGNSLENDGYISKSSQQQACLDMYYASVKLLDSQDHPVSNLFLGGWSQGGLVTVDFLEKLQSVGIPVTKAATASAPANVQYTSNLWYFHPRTYPQSLPNTPDAIWLNVVGELSNFSITGYAGADASPLQMLGVNYEVARAMYMREYNALSFVPPVLGGTGIVVHRAGLSDVVLPYPLPEVIAPQFADNQALFEQTDYAKLLASSGAGSSYLLTAPLGMYYGQEDEVIPLTAGTAVYNAQTTEFQNDHIWAPEVAWANHRGTFLAAVRGELAWFNGETSIPEVIPPTQPVIPPDAQ